MTSFLGFVAAAMLLLAGPLPAAESAEALEILGPRDKRQSLSHEAMSKAVTPETVTVWDPHVEGDATYVGFRVVPLFDAATDRAWRGVEDVVITCADGYQAVIPAQRFTQSDAFLVFERQENPDFTVVNALQGNERVALGPYYLVWDVTREQLKAEGAHDWPYQVTTISFLDAAERLLSIGPPEGSPPPVKRGFLAYRDNCLPCHAVNGDGGTKSIDLVRPYSPVEYWKQSWLERWILNPAELRPGTTMSALAVQGEEGKRIASDIVAYLEAMARARRVKE
jgi:hypothetical protein